jgi:hypothetical protein
MAYFSGPVLDREGQETWRKSISSQFIFEQLEEMSLRVKKVTVGVLDNAAVYVARVIQGCRLVWQL